MKEKFAYNLGYRKAIRDVLEKLPNGHGKLIVSIAYQPDYVLDYDDIKAEIKSLLPTKK